MKYVIIFSFLLTTCNNQSNISALNNDDLCQCWRFSYEESTEEVKTYRPCDYNFPPSRGREGMTFSTDNTFVYSAIAPADGFMELNGNWNIEDNILTMNYTAPNDKTTEFKVLEIKQNIIRLMPK